MYDVIIVGARVAGAPTAMLLARKGYKVLMVDKSSFPSDIAHSTLLIWPPGVELMRRFGVLDAVIESGAPPIERCRGYIGPPYGEPQIILDGPPAPYMGSSVSYAPRRFVLDKILVDAAVEAGVDFKEAFTVESLIEENGQVVGIRGKTQNGTAVVERAKLVVGADGARSIVADQVGAKEYKSHDPVVTTKWAYWEGIELQEGCQLEFAPQTYGAVYAWPTNDERMLIGCNWARALQPPGETAGPGYAPKSTDWKAEFERIGQAPEKAYEDMLAQCAPWLSEQCKTSAQRVGGLVGGYARSFFRESHGPGWALVGDAGSCYEFSTAHGMTNAMRSALMMSEAIDEGFSGRMELSEAMAGYQRKRDEAEGPYYDFTLSAGCFQPVDDPAATGALYAAIANSPEGTQGFWGVFSQTVHPADFFAPANLQELMAA